MLSKEEFSKVVEEVFKFHTKRAPGIAIGVAMVDYARDELGEVKEKMNAVAETQACLSDVIQVMTGCTMGNRYLRILKDLGRYALTLFDRADGRGVRVSVAFNKLDWEKTPELSRFFHRKRGSEVEKGGKAREQSGIKIMDEFDRVGRSILVAQKVRLKTFGKPSMLPALVCTECGESFLSRNENHAVCDFCSKESDYFVIEK